IAAVYTLTYTIFGCAARIVSARSKPPFDPQAAVMNSSVMSSFRMGERLHCPRLPDPMRFDVQKVGGPRLPPVGRAIAAPREVVGMNVVVADAPERRMLAAVAEPLLDADLRAVAMRGAGVRPSGARLGGVGL